MPEPALEHVFRLFGIVPARYTHPDWAAFVGFPVQDYWPFLTSMFLHGGWLHIIGNMWALWIFGDNVEDRMGPIRFVIFYLLCGIIAGVVHVWTNPDSTVPTVGASGAIAGVLGAYIVLFPYARVIVLLPIFIIPFFFELPAILYLGFWALSQVFSGTLALAQPGDVGGVAWCAHVGGFASGMVLHFFFVRHGAAADRRPARDEYHVEGAWLPRALLEAKLMTPGDILWMFFMFSALQPVLKQRLLEASRQRLIGKIERERNSRVILLVHRQETMSILGFPVFRYIDVNDSEEVLRAIHLTDDKVPLDIVMHTPGGLVLAAFQIARAIHKHRGKVTAFVPHYAMSGGTLIALAANEIVMSEYAVLGPVDPQMGQYPAASAASVLKAVAKKPIAEVDDQTLILADQGEKAIVQIKEGVRELLSDKFPPEKAAELSRLLSEGTWTHDHPITFEKATDFGLPVRSDIPPEVLDLMGLYPQPVRRQPTVEYLPERRRFDGARGSR